MHTLARQGRGECRENHHQPTIRQSRSEILYGAAPRIFVVIVICIIMFARSLSASSSSSSPSLLLVGAFELPAAGCAGACLPFVPAGRRIPRGRRSLRCPAPSRVFRPVVVATSSGRYSNRGPACGRSRLGASYPASSSYSSSYDGSGGATDEDESAEPFSPGGKGTATMTAKSNNAITPSDRAYMNLALERARMGFGYTYPNPAVGCVLVRSTSTPRSDGSQEDEEEGGGGGGGRGEVIGTGFHPRAGMPHAEVFALLEACGAVDDGTAAAASVVESRPGHRSRVLAGRPGPAATGDVNAAEVAAMRKAVARLAAEYSSEGGAERLLSGCCDTNDPDTFVTAYVTLEPCCHRGRTPPCATSLVLAGVDRVVVGCRDPNPRVDGGGVSLLRDAGVSVDLMADGGRDDDDATREVAETCAGIVECFVKRITRDEVDYDSIVTGRHRSALRSLAGRRKAERTLPEIGLLAGDVIESETESVTFDVEGIFDSIPGWWLEEADSKLWSDELLLLRLGEVAPKKKLAKQLGTRIASDLGAHVAQTLGHTVLLYRPGSPPILDPEELAASTAKSKT